MKGNRSEWKLIKQRIGKNTENELKSWFSEKNNKIHKTLAWLIKTKEMAFKLLELEMKNETSYCCQRNKEDYKRVLWIILCNKLDTQNKIGKVLETHKFLNWLENKKTIWVDL